MAVTIECTLDEALQQCRDSLKSSLASTRARYRRELRQIRANAKWIAKLAVLLPPVAELRVNGAWAYESPFVHFPREALPLIRRAVGRLHVDRKSLQDAEAGILRIHLTAEKFPGIVFTYDRPLGEGMTCRIVEQTSTYKTLVCSVE